MEKTVVLKERDLPQTVLKSRIIEVEEIEWNDEIKNWFKKTDVYLYRVNKNLYQTTIDFIPLTGQRAGKVAFLNKEIKKDFQGHLEIISGVETKYEIKLNDHNLTEIGKNVELNDDMFVSVSKLQEQYKNQNERTLQEILIEKQTWGGLGL